MIRAPLITAAAVLLLSGCFSSVEDETSTPEGGLVALYTFTEGGGIDVADSSGFSDAHLLIDANGDVFWSSDPPGLVFGPDGARAYTQAPPLELGAAIMEAEAFTLEVWCQPTASDSLDGRILSYSSDNRTRNLALVQTEGNIGVRLAISDPRVDANGVWKDGGGTFGEPLVSFAGAASPRRYHYAVTYAEGSLKLYIDGALRDEALLSGSLGEAWNEAFPLNVGNEVSGERPWEGILHRVALFDTALSAETLAERHAAGL